MGNSNFPNIPSQISFGTYDLTQMPAGFVSSQINWYPTSSASRWVVTTMEINFASAMINATVQT